MKATSVSVRLRIFLFAFKIPNMHPHPRATIGHRSYVVLPKAGNMYKELPIEKGTIWDYPVFLGVWQWLEA